MTFEEAQQLKPGDAVVRKPFVDSSESILCCERVLFFCSTSRIAGIVCRTMLNNMDIFHNFRDISRKATAADLMLADEKGCLP